MTQPHDIYKCWWCGKKFTILARKNRHEKTCSERPTNGDPHKEVIERFGGLD